MSLQPYFSRLRAGIYAPVRLFRLRRYEKRFLFCPFGRDLLLLPGLLGGRVSAPMGIKGYTDVWGIKRQILFQNLGYAVGKETENRLVFTIPAHCSQPLPLWYSRLALKPQEGQHR